MNEHKGQSLDVLVPRGLIGNFKGVCSAPVTAEGLCSCRIRLQDGYVSSLEAIGCEHEAPLKLLLPRLVEPHAHIDKAFTWTKFPNLKGTYQGALEANLKEHQSRTTQLVRSRAEKALNLSLKNGLRAVRSHVDSFGVCANQHWDALLELQKEWKPFIELQLVALVPLEYWSTHDGHLLAKRVAASGGFLGGVLVPPCNKKEVTLYLTNMLRLAKSLGCGIDLHIDESTTHFAVGLKQLIKVLDQISFNIPITCSHASSMGLLADSELRNLADRLAQHDVNVVALPITNAWLLSRKSRTTSVNRPLAPIAQLQEAGVLVAVGSDNVQDPWFPGGNFDPLALMSSVVPLAQLAPWNRLGLAPLTTAAANVMDLDWDGTITQGSPADFLLLAARNWTEALSSSPFRQVMIKGKWLDESN